MNVRLLTVAILTGALFAASPASAELPYKVPGGPSVGLDLGSIVLAGAASDFFQDGGFAFGAHAGYFINKETNVKMEFLFGVNENRSRTYSVPSDGYDILAGGAGPWTDPGPLSGIDGLPIYQSQSDDMMTFVLGPAVERSYKLSHKRWWLTGVAGAALYRLDARLEEDEVMLRSRLKDPNNAADFYPGGSRVGVAPDDVFEAISFDFDKAENLGGVNGGLSITLRSETELSAGVRYHRVFGSDMVTEIYSIHFGVNFFGTP
jgi:hypothetical protein